MKGLLLRWAVSALALYITALLSQWISGWTPDWLDIAITLEGWYTFFLAVVVLAVINALIRPMLVLLTLPLNCLTLGLFAVLINAAMFLLAGELVPGFTVKGFDAALFGSIMMGIIGGLANSLVRSKES